jgi:hypothetical protein
MLKRKQRFEIGNFEKLGTSAIETEEKLIIKKFPKKKFSKEK